LVIDSEMPGAAAFRSTRTVMLVLRGEIGGVIRDEILSAVMVVPGGVNDQPR
jgi:hypothetical protein